MLAAGLSCSQIPPISWLIRPRELLPSTVFRLKVQDSKIKRVVVERLTRGAGGISARESRQRVLPLAFAIMNELETNVPLLPNIPDAGLLPPVDVIKSEEDPKLYRVITLNNGLMAVLIHDPEIKSLAMESMAMTVGWSEEHAHNVEVDEEDNVEESEWETASEDNGAGSPIRQASSTARAGGYSTNRKLRIRQRQMVQHQKVEDVDDTDDEDTEDYEPDEEEEEEEEDDYDDDDDDEDEEDDDEETDESEYDDSEDEAGVGTRGRDGNMAATKKAGAAMCVGVGSFSDPRDAQGLAHFLEHMLFMGSKKFPDENEYDSFLTKHGGASNAYTETEHTVFHFDVNDGFLQPALDRFAQFFIAPLAKEEAMEREVQAVNSEFDQALQSDSCRLQQVQCHTANPEHPFSKFSWGNRKSLSGAGKEMRQKLMELYLQHYRAGRMRLAVLGGEPLDILETWVRELFEDVPSGSGQAAPACPLPGLPPGSLWPGGCLYEIESVKEQHQVAVSWPLPCFDAAYQKKPHDYVSHLLGHEGTGSVLALLKSKGWATSLSAGVGDGGYERNASFYMFAVHISLTLAGLENVMEVLGVVYQYLAMLRQTGPKEWVFKELQAMAAMEFRFAEEEGADDYTVRLATNMHLYPPKDIVFGDYVLVEWDPALISSVLGHLTPGNMRVDILTRPFSSPPAEREVEPWFEVAYARKAIPADLLQQWTDPLSIDASLHLPPVNEFIPSDFTLLKVATSAVPAVAAYAKSAGALSDERSAEKLPTMDEAVSSVGAALCSSLEKGHGLLPEASSHDVPGHLTPQLASFGPAAPWESSGKHSRAPRVVFDDQNVRLWYREDETFRTPRANVYVAITTPAANDSASSVALTELFVKLLEDSLNEITYLANVAKLDSSISASGPRLELKFHGFNHKLTTLATRVFHQLRDFQVSPDRFEVLREELLRTYRNANTKPLKQSAYLRLRILKQQAWGFPEKEAALEQASPADLQAFLPRLFAKVHVEGLVHGNLTELEALTLVNIMKEALPAHPLSPEEWPHERVVELPAGVSLVRSSKVKNEAEENSVLEMYFQGAQDWGRLSVKAKSVADLFEQIVEEPFYDQLRTKEQLGYRVDCGVRQTHRVGGICARVQSAEHSPTHLQARIEAFFLAFRQTLEVMPDGEFNSHREALIAQKLKKSCSLLDESHFLWEQIWEGRYLFDGRLLEVEALQAIEKPELLTWFDENIAAGSAARRMLTVQVWGHSKVPEVLAVNSGSKVTLVEDEEEFKQSCPLFPEIPCLGSI